ncbi:endoglucanase [Fontimonas thermophila]|uniref:cellulase n=1 Tax=Fontimonas thermophila TaxID=1076937 RepID=A0A1I2JEX4_9GAMM|nr:cellulose synthase complex periplasmic endoglucanase BcsZ [Fontimonas thermophila]SFF53104.1 endoglucanase [Fontimonas thermophila]
MNRLHAACAAAVLLCAGFAAQADAHCGTWPEWEQYARTFMSTDGRIIDPHSPRQHTVSEAQAYAMFFALVGNDRRRFETLLQWTENNLAQGDLTAHLPAWQWGRRDDGSWGVLDANPASDADLWMAYVLAEAGQLWQQRRYRVLSAVLAQRILDQEVADLPGLGQTLLPAPTGFVSDAGWRLNPSYVPMMLLRRLHALRPQQGWDRLLESTRRLITESAVHGYAPDWVLWRHSGGFAPDAQTEARGSYDAIRVYLWAGMLNAADPAHATLVERLTPMLAATRARGAPPERIDTRDGTATGDGNFGFAAALLPLSVSAGDTTLAARLAERVRREAAQAPDWYYSQSLRLFGEGWYRGWYRFAADGRLLPAWENRCTVGGSR